MDEEKGPATPSNNKVRQEPVASDELVTGEHSHHHHHHHHHDHSGCHNPGRDYADDSDFDD